MINLNNLKDAQFLGSKEASGCDSLPCFGCDAGPLPPGCDCICHTSCDFGKSQSVKGAKGSKYSPKNKVYEMK